MIQRLLVLLVLCAAVVAHAEDPAMRSAKRHYDRGEKLFALGKFDEALDEYQKAFDAKPLPGFLFNIGQCYRNLGDYDQAIFSFKKYLKGDPDAPNKDAVQKLIDDLETKKERGEGEKFVGKQPAKDTSPPPHPADHTPIYKQWWFWTGIAVVSIGGGIGVYEATRGGPPATDLGNLTFAK